MKRSIVARDETRFQNMSVEALLARAADGELEN
jgi:hypothetical protein